MVKSALEQQYERLVLTRICQLDLASEEKAEILVDYIENSRMYYDLLCDMVFDLAINKMDGRSLWISINGKPYLSHVPKDELDELLISADDCPDFEGDIIPHLQLICKNLGIKLCGEGIKNM